MLNHQFLGLNKFTNHDAGERLKYGFEKWDNKDHAYEGTFLRNSLHGYGTLKKQNLWTYEGNFYSNFKEGYAVLSLANHSYFEGLFIQNQPFGPGILTYSNGRQDVGFWVGRKLVRLSRPVDFIVPRLAATISAKMKLLLLQRLIPLTEENFDSVIEMFEKNLPVHLFSSNLYDPRSLFFDSPSFEKAYFMISNESHKGIKRSFKNPQNVNINESETELAKDKCDSNIDMGRGIYNENVNEFYEKEKFSENDICNDYQIFTSEEQQRGILTSHYKMLGKIDALSDNSTLEYLEIDCEGEVESEREVEAENNERIPAQMIFKNKGELCSEILKLIFRYKAFEEKLNVKIAELMTGIRTAFRNTGEKERVCLQFLKMCSSGPPQAVKNLLCCSEISEELMDSRGNNGIMFAVASDQREIIDILLDYGVNVNSFNDENLTPLNLCLLRRLAQANGICSWETAFLPPVLSETLENDQKFSDFPIKNSIQSLDRFVGDGMSIVNLSENNNFNVTKSVTSTNHTEKKEKRLSNVTDTIRDMQSQITILNFESNFETEIEKKNSSSECNSILFGGQEQTLNMKQKISPNFNKKEEFDKSVSKCNNDKYLFQLFTDDFEEKQEINESEKDKVHVKMLGKVGHLETDSNLIKRLLEIDKTIEKLLQRGADPNISVIPRPSIHLAIFTKNINLVELFLRYGANPNSQINFNEGLLTPLHVLVLIKPAPEYISICELLLSFGANPDEETAPNFSIWKGEKNFLDESHGRTPLQLLCMRPDLEHGDPNGHIIKIGLLLAKVSNKKHFFNGHSCLTLAMLTGNVKLFKGFLQSGFFDPNEKLGKDLGTALQVLLSSNFQQKPNFDKRAVMCNLLTSAGANALPKFNTPSSLRSSAVEFARRPTETGRKLHSTNLIWKNGKPNVESKNGLSRNNLKDYPKIFQSLDDVAAPKTSTKNQSQADLSPSKKKINSKNKSIKLKSKSHVRNKVGKKASGFQTNQSKENIIFINEDIHQEYKKNTLDGNHKKTTFDKKRKSEKNSISTHSGIINAKFENISKRSGEKDVKKRKSVPYDIFAEPNVNRKFKQNFLTKKRPRNVSRNPTEISERELDEFKKKKTFEKGMAKSLTGYIVEKRKLPNNKAKRMFPKALRNSLLNLFGNCVNIDINQFFLPYVVLRDGNLYYRFINRPGIEKEQYSLV